MSSSSRITASHAGIERVLTGAGVLRSTLQTVFSAKNFNKLITAAVVMGGITVVERMLDAMDTNFAEEWIILTATAVIAFYLAVVVVIPVVKLLRNWIVGLNGRLAEIDTERAMFESAARDPRIMNDFLIAQSRRESRYDESMIYHRKPQHAPESAPWHALARYW